MEFASEKGILFDKWCQSSKVSDFAKLQELVLLEDFKKCLPERMVTYLNEPKVASLAEAVLLSDEFASTPKNVFFLLRCAATPQFLQKVKTDHLDCSGAIILPPVKTDRVSTVMNLVTSSHSALC